MRQLRWPKNLWLNASALISMVTVFIMDRRESLLSRQKVAQGQSMDEADAAFEKQFKHPPAWFDWAYYCIELERPKSSVKSIVDFDREKGENVVCLDDEGFRLTEAQLKRRAWSKRR